MPQGGEGESAQHDLEGAVGKALAVAEVERPLLAGGLAIVLRVKQQIEKRRRQIGPIRLRD